MATATHMARRISERTLGWCATLTLSPVAAVAGWQIGKVLWFGVVLGG